MYDTSLLENSIQILKEPRREHSIHSTFIDLMLNDTFYHMNTPTVHICTLMTCLLCNK